jgi:hypothetical protein
MKLRTDDDIWRARLVWLGPDEYPMPFHWPYAQWGLLVVLAAAFLGIGSLIAGWYASGTAIAAAIVATKVVWRYVDADLPAHKFLYAIATDWRATASPAERPLPRLSAGKIRIGGDGS